MARVFLSHASEDRILAAELHEWLGLEGHEVFLAEDLRDGIAVGEEWQQRLHERLLWADAVVCVVTSAYVASRWCTAEAAISWWRGSRLLPLRAEPGIADPLLSSLQHIDYTQDPGAARVALHEALRRVDAAGGQGWPEGRSPFPGLRPFDIEQHRVFFGRANESGELAELLRSPAERPKGAALLVVGPSGCGKSSLVRAGVLPLMAEEPGWWTLAPIVPGADPVAALVRELATAARRFDLGWTVADVRDQLDKDGLTGVVDELLLAAPRGSRRLLVVVDQFEELLTQAAPADRVRFAELLRPALAGPVQLMLTLRSEFLDQLLLEDEPAALPMRTYPLRPLGEKALRAVIEKPARLVGIGVDDDLVDRLVEDTGSGEALPLLAFTLAQLAEGVGRGGQLSRERYDQLGGVQGALTRQAEQALVEARTASGRSREEVISGLLGLVTVDEEGRRTRRRVLRQQLPHPVTDEVDAFIARRLLTTDSGNGSAVIAVAHEAFLSAWAPLAQAITAAAAALRARHALEYAAAAWDEQGRPSARLWTGGQLAAVVADTGARVQTRHHSSTAPPGQRQRPSRWPLRPHRELVTHRVADLREEARDFLHASIRRDRFRRRRVTTILSVLLVLALTAAGLAIFQQRVAEEQQRIATARQLVAQADATRDTDPRTALRLGIAAQRIHPDGETHASLVNTLTTTHYAGTLTGLNSPVTAMAFSPHAPTLVTGHEDGGVVLWDFTNPTQPHRLGQALTNQDGSLSNVVFSPTGSTLATRSVNGTVTLWDLIDSTQPRRLGTTLTDPSRGGPGSLAFSPAGATLAISDGDGSVVLWDVTNPNQPHRLGQPLTNMSSMAFAPNRSTLAIGGHDGSVVLWDLTNPNQSHRLGQFLASPSKWQRSVSSLLFSPAGTTVAISDGDGSVVLWDITNPNQPHRLGQPLASPNDRPIPLAFSPVGTTLATGHKDGSVVLWDLTNPAGPRRLGQPLTNQDGSLSDVVFSPTGSTLVTRTVNGTVTLWDLTDPTQPRHFGTAFSTNKYKYVSSMAFSPDGRTLAADGVEVTLWDLTNPVQPHPLGPPLITHGDTISLMAFAPNGPTLATGSGGVVLWNLTNPAQPRPLGPPLTKEGSAVAFASHGPILATSSDSDGAVLWNLTNLVQPRRLGPPLMTNRDGHIIKVVLSADGRTLAGTTDNGVILWDFTNPIRPRRLGSLLTGQRSQVSSAVFSPEGHTLAASTYDGAVILWDLTKATQPRRLWELSTPGGSENPVTFSPNGTTLATSNHDGVTLWDLTNSARPRQLGQPLTGATSPVAFSPSGTTLATGSSDGIILWDLTALNNLRDHATEHACAITGGGLDRDEWTRYIPVLAYQNTCPVGR